ncbi:hypothetical protein CORC01_13165 [Colletotrichum orchidophilum]|uniref:Uncharacterized protein n=1 Tax=Colletotrichum orchidophilum TaxID=1209926 RepID=A0A1G4AQY6_9PEZI|nr:uncharacterized protein CORC01_13165 [Colletotrichum orchidophilum]OHE91516.1 hypothetical protein CORC01_13165 [Colletotrichum orchidophilum]
MRRKEAKRHGRLSETPKMSHRQMLEASPAVSTCSLAGESGTSVPLVGS